jgi:hypothetical protein
MVSHVVSFYPLEGLARARVRYRLVDIQGAYGCETDDGDLVEKNLNLLLKQVAFREEAPVALVTRDEKRVLAIPAEVQLGELDYALTPHVVTLKPREETHEIDFGRLNAEGERIGLAFLAYQLRSPLMRHASLWRAGPSMYFLKRPVNWKNDSRDVDVYRGFGFRLIRIAGAVYLGLRIAHKYVDSAWFVDRCRSEEFDTYRMRRFLYFFGNRWFPIQLLGRTGDSIRNAKFQAEPGGPIRNVHEYTAEKAGSNAPNWIRTLDPASPAIQYRYPGKDGRFYGAAALCKLMLKNQEQGVRTAHRLSIMEPEERFALMRELVEEYFPETHFGGRRVTVRAAALRVEPRVFTVPSQVFGRNKCLSVASPQQTGEIQLRDLGRARLSFLLEGGLAVAKGFDGQHLLAPQGLHRQIVEDFRERLQKTVRQMAQMPFSLTPVLFRDEGRTLRDQVQAICQAADSASITHGHGVLILPARANPDLHNYVKRTLLDRMALQCVSEEQLQRFYELRPDKGKAEYRVKVELENRYVSYLRYTALGVLIANRQWPWVLEKPKCYDLYIGIDVLHNTAAFTFFADGGRVCFVRTYQSKQKEKLSRGQMKTAIYESLKEMLALFKTLRPRSIVIHRDGRTYHCEWKGFLDAIQQLKAEGRIAGDTQAGIVEIHKHSALGARLVVEKNCRLLNPPIGSWLPVSTTEGVVCTTGYPFKVPGTVDPLHASIAYGQLDLEKVLRDIFCMSQLCWMTPDRCIRLPIDVKLCDDVLRSVAGEADEDEAQYGEEMQDDVVHETTKFSQSEAMP